jgi:SAM-dependent methyltransferase
MTTSRSIDDPPSLPAPGPGTPHEIDQASRLYVEPRLVTNLNDCYFYHTMEVPGYGLVEGEWDLRDGVREYLGNVDFRGKRVLELGTASGFVCFHMERNGAEVVAYDLSDKQAWDVVPFHRYEYDEFLRRRREHLRKTNNAFWLCHRAYNSQSKVVYGDVYSIPQDIGVVDICTCCSILLHVRDPFLALQQALRLTRETVIVTEPAGIVSIPRPLSAYRRLLPRALRGSPMHFLPDWRTTEPKETWWRLSPELIQSFIGTLGFEKSVVTHHYQTYRRGRINIRLRQFTVVGHRSSPERFQLPK